MTNPYSPPTLLASQADNAASAQNRLALPASALIVLSAINSVIWSIYLVSLIINSSWRVSIGANPFGLAISIVQFVAPLIICVGAAQMGHLKSLRMARIAAVLSCIPTLTPFFILGIPFGIWSLLLLGDVTIQSEFASKIDSECGG